MLASPNEERSIEIKEQLLAWLVPDEINAQLAMLQKKTQGNLTKEEADNHPKKHILSSALGYLNNNSKIDILERRIKKEDIYVLCTDGLHNMLDNITILRIIEKNKEKSLYQTGLRLILQANNMGGTDNITVVIVSFA